MNENCDDESIVLFFEDAMFHHFCFSPSRLKNVIKPEVLFTSEEYYLVMYYSEGIYVVFYFPRI